jgi:retron-type reverse transcriptase
VADKNIDSSKDNLYEQICSYENLELAYLRAKKRKSKKDYVVEFEKNLKENLFKLRIELLMQVYEPKKLVTFIIRDPKTRKISKSDFRDRIIHHAICNIIEPMFDKSFIYDSYANRIGKGTLNAIKRFDYFKRKVSKNNTKNCYVLKADVRHYFESVNHNILVNILKRKISDDRVLWLVEKILSNYHNEKENIGMPLGNLTSQFFANVYLNELDQFVKHTLKAKYYIRYVDDFIILDTSKEKLKLYQNKIDYFLKENLGLELHPDKTKIILLSKGVGFLGFRLFYYHKLVRKKNMIKFKKRFEELKDTYESGLIKREIVIEKFQGFLAYISTADTYKYRRLLASKFNDYFSDNNNQNNNDNITKYKSFHKIIVNSTSEYTAQKTLFFLRKGPSVQEIAKHRNLKESTVWSHTIKLIEHSQYSVFDLLLKQKIFKILSKIISETDTLNIIKDRLNDKTISFNEIACVLAYYKLMNTPKTIIILSNWYMNKYCRRNCTIQQRLDCKHKLDDFISKNKNLMMKRNEFVEFLRNQTNICNLH